MYDPSLFDESDTEVIHELMRKNPLGILITNGSAGLDANHIPFGLDSKQGHLGILSAHVARANPIWQEVSDGDEVLVVFRAGDAYISPNWYPSKHEFHKQVPTWNYMVAHAHGRIKIRDDERFVRGVVGRLTKTHEASQPTPWKMADSCPDFIASLLGAIVGVEIEITRLVGKLKLSQDEEIRDLRNAGNELNDCGYSVIGDAMLEQLKAKLIKS
jgi:transcriptional regulator